MSKLFARKYDFNPVAFKTIGEVFGLNPTIGSLTKNLWKMIKDNNLPYTNEEVK